MHLSEPKENTAYDSEAVRLAWKMYETETAHKQKQEALLSAASELGLPPAYIERASTELVRRKRRRRLGALAGAGAAIALASAIGTASVLNHSSEAVAPLATNTQTVAAAETASAVPVNTEYVAEASAPPKAATTPSLTFDFTGLPQPSWYLRSSPGSEGTLTYVKDDLGKRCAHIEIRRFGRNPDGTFAGQYFVELRNDDDTVDLSSCHTVTFRARGNGLPHIRLALWGNGPRLSTELWNSPTVDLTPQWKQYQLPLHAFFHSHSQSSNSPMELTDPVPPGKVGAVEFETGVYVNPFKSHGWIEIDKLAFK